MDSNVPSPTTADSLDATLEVLELIVAGDVKVTREDADGGG